MYNRYIPQPDGSYRRSTAAEPKPKPRPPQPEGPAPRPEPPRQTPPKPEPPMPPAGGLGFLKQLLPKNMDAGDLIVVLLLILMAGDCQEERSNALLTLALYFIM